MQVLDHGVEVEALEFLGVVEALAHRIGGRVARMQHADIEVLRPPVAVPVSAGAAGERALARFVVGLCVHVFSPMCRAPHRPCRVRRSLCRPARSSGVARIRRWMPLAKCAVAVLWKISKIRSSRIVLRSRSVYLIGDDHASTASLSLGARQTRPFRPRRRGLFRDPARAVDADPRSGTDPRRRGGGAAAGRRDADRGRARDRAARARTC